MSFTELTCELDPSVFECQICFDMLKPPIYLCSKGHSSVCTNCQQKTNGKIKCAVCQLDMTRVRNHLAEEIVNSMIIKCPQAYCQMDLTYGQFEAHLMTCQTQKRVMSPAAAAAAEAHYEYVGVSGARFHSGKEERKKKEAAEEKKKLEEVEKVRKACIQRKKEEDERRKRRDAFEAFEAEVERTRAVLRENSTKKVAEEARQREILRKKAEEEVKRRELLRKEAGEEAKRRELLRKEAGEEAKRRELLRKEAEEEVKRREILRKKAEEKKQREAHEAEERRREKEREVEEARRAQEEVERRKRLVTCWYCNGEMDKSFFHRLHMKQCRKNYNSRNVRN